MLRFRRSPRGRSRGLSLVELMVGVAVGLIVVAGALSMTVQNLSGSTRLLADARFNQDLRAAVDLITRDLRRAGYWGNAIAGTQAVGATAVTTPNPYRGVTGSTANGFSYQFSRDQNAAENNALDTNERFGFRVQSGALQMRRDDGDWEDVTDTKVMTIATGGLVITPSVTTVSLGNLCPRTCTAGTPNCPTTTVRSFAVTLTATGTGVRAAQRSLSTTVRLRNDQLDGACPA